MSQTEGLNECELYANQQATNQNSCLDNKEKKRGRL